MHVQRNVTGCILVLAGMAVLGIAAACSGTESSASIEAVRSLLRQVPVFQRLDDNQLKELASAADVVVRQDGDRIIEQGKRTGNMAIALDSEVDIRIDGATLRLLPPNSLVGEIEFLEDCPSSADVVLLGKSRVILLEHGRFQGVMDADPALGYRMMREIARMEANRLRTNPTRPPK